MLFLLLFVSLACDGPAPAARRPVPEPPPRTDAPAYAPRGDGPGRGSAWRVLSGVQRDDLYDSDEPIRVVRLVYQVTLQIPAALGTPPRTFRRPRMELIVEATEERLRAYFKGPGWPVPDGAEVRLRHDLGGTYAFDERGGRPLSPGVLSEWFQGGPLGDHRPAVGIRPAFEPGYAPGALACGLIAEWGGEARAGFVRRCQDRGGPIRFRVGPWLGERTAELMVQMPRRALRADHEDPPDPLPSASGVPLLSPSQLRRLPPGRGKRNSAPLESRGPAPESGLVVRNPLAVRVVVTANGAPVGWVGPEEEVGLPGLADGLFNVAAMRPLGSLGWSPHLVRVPARIELVRPRLR